MMLNAEHEMSLLGLKMSELLRLRTYLNTHDMPLTRLLDWLDSRQMALSGPLFEYTHGRDL